MAYDGERMFKTPTTTKRFGLRAFSLVEIMTSTAMIAIITVGLGVAVFKNQHRAQQARAGYADLQKRNDVLDRIAEDLRWATDISHLSGSRIRCTVPIVGSPDTFEELDYRFVSGNSELQCSRDSAVDDWTIANVTTFTIAPDLITSDGSNNYINSIIITFGLGADHQTILERTIYFANTPPFSGAMEP